MFGFFFCHFTSFHAFPCIWFSVQTYTWFGQLVKYSHLHQHEPLQRSNVFLFRVSLAFSGMKLKVLTLHVGFSLNPLKKVKPTISPVWRPTNLFSSSFFLQSFKRRNLSTNKHLADGTTASPLSLPVSPAPPPVVPLLPPPAPAAPPSWPGVSADSVFTEQPQKHKWEKLVCTHKHSENSVSVCVMAC